MFMSENTCALVDLFDKAVAEGERPNTEHEVATLERDIEIQIGRWKHIWEPSPNSIALVVTGPADQKAIFLLMLDGFLQMIAQNLN